MSKNIVPCGGFELDKNFLGMNKNGELSLIGGGSEGEAFKQLVTDSEGAVKWEDRLAYDNRTVLIEQTRVTNANTVDGPVINPSFLVNGTPVIVNIDGTEYNATLEEGGTYMIGSGSAQCYYHIGTHGGINLSDHTTFTSDYPFFVAINGGGTCMVLFDRESIGTEHEFAIYSGSIKQIDPKYIPSKEAFFVASGQGSFRTGTDWDKGEDATIADIVSAYHDGGAKIFQMSGINCIGISNVIGASAPGSSSPFITYYNYTSKTVFTKS